MKTLNFCTYIRVIGMVSILLCHFVPHHPNPYVQMSAQFFNIGVQIFFILSGFLLGLQGRIKDTGAWYKKRLTRIYIPWVLFVGILACVHLIIGNNILTWNWLKLLLGLQGINVGVAGAGQTWFVTCLLICYLFTPLIRYLIEKDFSRIIAILLVFWPMGLALLTTHNLFTLLSPLSWYGLAYLCGSHYDEKYINSKTGILAISIAICALITRFGIHILTDSPIWYDQIGVGYTQAIAAAGVMLFVAWIAKGKEPSKAIVWLSSISFEVYLYHYMMSAGPISLFSVTPYWMLNAVLITGITLCIAYISHTAAGVITKRIA